MENQLHFELVDSDDKVTLAAALADEIWHECYAELLTRQQIDYMVENLQSAGAIRRQIDAEGYEYYLLQAEGADAPCGYIALQPKDGKLYLSKIYLLLAARGNGYIAQIMAFAEGAAQRHACHTLWLTVNRGNARAVAAYQKTGFSIARTQVADIGGGFVMDDYIFEKAL